MFFPIPSSASLPSLADLFWWLATSTLVLVALGLFGVAARFASWFGRLPLVPQAAPFLVFARPASTIAFAALLFFGGFRLADERSDIKQVRRDLAGARQQIDNMQATADDAELLERKANAKADVLDQKVKKYEQGHRLRTGCGFDQFDVDWLSDIQRRAVEGRD